MQTEMAFTAVANTFASSLEADAVQTRTVEKSHSISADHSSCITTRASSYIDKTQLDINAIEQALRLGQRHLALTSCVRTMSRSIGRLCFAMLGSQTEAEEAVQETFLVAFDHASSYRGEGTVRAWLFGIARHICAKKLEVRTRQIRRTHVLNYENASIDSVETVMDAKEQEEQVRSALAVLRPTEREALLLRFESELSFREVAAACNLDETTARKRVERALKKLRLLVKI